MWTGNSSRRNIIASQSAEKYQTIESAEKWWVNYGELGFFQRFE